MQFSLHLDMLAVSRWDLNLSQAAVFAYVHSCSSWCDKLKEDPEFYNIANSKIATELSCLSDKRDTMLRHVLALVEAGVIERRTVKSKQYVKLTAKGLEWHRRADEDEVVSRPGLRGKSEHRENNPGCGQVGKHREENPATDDSPGKTSRSNDKQRDISPAPPGNSSNVSVNQTSIKPKTHACGRASPVDNSGTAPASNIPPTLADRIDRVAAVFLAAGYEASVLDGGDTRRRIGEWIRHGLTQRRLQAWIATYCSEGSRSRPDRPIEALDARILAELQKPARSVDQAEATAREMRAVKKSHRPEDMAEINRFIGRKSA